MRSSCIAAIAACGVRCGPVQAKAEPHRPVNLDRVGGIEVAAPLQSGHAIGAVQVIDDMTELDLVDVEACHAMVPAMRANPDRMPGLESDPRCTLAIGPGQQGIEARGLLARLLDPPQIPPLRIGLDDR
jgi:hypothetical protein